MSLIEGLNKDFESRVRLGIMSILMVNEWVEFGEIKDLLNLTDGNLASHSKTLEKKKYIEIKKEFVGKKPKTSYKATKIGKEAFQKHITALENLLK
ncbi:transcriptional regulator [Flavobacteriaceae bacterium Ap0902]|nr:transcriptional regulator [Flavobacteriaceae bacterium Ap0902]